jgi:hypothetical protein
LSRNVQRRNEDSNQNWRVRGRFAVIWAPLTEAPADELRLLENDFPVLVRVQAVGVNPLLLKALLE